MHSPTLSHMLAAKHVLHYIADTISEGIMFRKSSSLCRTTFSNSN